ncbi:hypothetical protein [Peribacillus sp. SCS-155]|uniref:hypothetical protein n=1 Tax=Peribacillus sedimenti TaxID=3115297 RepID=UPI003905C584
MKINEFLGGLAHNYVLITMGAVLFFAVKAFAGFLTYKQINRKFTQLDQKLDRLLNKSGK